MHKLAATLLLVVAILAMAFVWMADLRPPYSNDFEPPVLEQPEGESFTVLSANVGGSDPRCSFQWLKLCRIEIEERLATNLAKVRPDLVALQETLPDHLCDRAPLRDPGHVCAHEFDVPQVRRLLGPDYSIICAERTLSECIGVRADVGEIVGCEPGGLCVSDRAVTNPPGCRQHLTIFAATVRIGDETFDVVNTHPENRNAECRLNSLSQVFEGDLIQEDRALILGDVNLDPWQGGDVSKEYWNRHVGSKRTHEFYYHSGPVETLPPYPTVRYPFFVRTLDHVVSNFFAGSTVTLGEAPGTPRLDGGRGTDHRALYGWIGFPKE